MLNLPLALCLTTMGFFVGTLSGFFGFGGGFILVPFLFSLGFPINISIGTSIMGIFMSSLVASLVHRRLGNVRVKAGLIIASTSIIGAEFGAQMIERLKEAGTQYMNPIISLAYILLLGSISICMIYGCLGSGRRKNPRRELWRGLKIPPFITIMQQDAMPVSVWVVAMIGFIGGLFAGFLGASGGFILVPLLIYVAGCRPSIAAGTCIFERLLSCVYASLTHALKGNVDFMLVTLLFIGSSIGVQLGALATKYVEEASFKMAFGLCLGLVSLSITVRLISGSFGMYSLYVLSQIIIFSAVSSIALLIIALFVSRTVKPKILYKRGDKL